MCLDFTASSVLGLLSKGMPPKKAAKGGGKSDKTKQAAKTKAIEDKTFGLKNKSKSAKVQGYVQQLQKSATVNQQQNNNEAKKDKKKAEADRQKELNDLFAIAIKQPKVPPGVDPKSIVCEYFRAGQCTKGFKCKFSHDLAVERKGGKIDLFTDTRQDEDDNMDEWDQEQLEKVVKQKHAAEASNKTDIICKFFLEAVEKKQYGWFWQCPNGGKDCKYRHALPPGYVLKSQMKELLELEAKNAISIEEEIEMERKKVDAKTPITEEVFSKWHNQKKDAVRKQQEEAIAERKRKGILSGREIFAQEGFMAEDDFGAHDDYQRELDEEAEFEQQRADAERRNAAENVAGITVLQEEQSAAAAQEQASSSSSATAAPHMNGKATSNLKISEEDQQQLFDDDDDEEDDELDDDDDGDMSDDQLDQLEAKLKQSSF